MLLSKIEGIDMAGICIGVVLFIVLLIPRVTTFFKRLYYSVHYITLETHRRLYFSLLDAFLMTLPSLLFAIHDILKSSSKTGAFKAMCRRYLPISAYTLLPCILAWFRPVAATPLDRFDILILIAFCLPLLINDLFPQYNILAMEIFRSDKLWVDFNSIYLLAATLSIFLYSVLRPLPDTGLGKEMKWPRAWDIFLVIFGTALLALAIPLVGFAKAIDHSSSPKLPVPWVLLNLVLMVVFIAIPIELIFRGVLQNLIHARVEVFWDIRRYLRDDDTNAKLKRYFSVNNDLIPQYDPNRVRDSMYQQEQLLELSLNLGSSAATPLDPQLSTSYRSFTPTQTTGSINDGPPSNNKDSPRQSSVFSGVFAKKRETAENKQSLLQNSMDQEFGRSSGTFPVNITESNGYNDYRPPKPLQLQYNFDPDATADFVDFVPNNNGASDGSIMLSTFSGTPLHTDNSNISRSSTSTAFSTNNRSRMYNVLTPRTPPSPSLNKGSDGGVIVNNPPHNSVNPSTPFVIDSRHIVESYHGDVIDSTLAALGPGHLSIVDAEIAKINFAQVNTDYNTKQTDIQSSNSGNSDLAASHAEQFLSNYNDSREKQFFLRKFEESPVWPTWQERHSAFYRRHKAHWLLFPSISDYFCLIFASMIYASTLLYPIMIFLNSDGDDHAPLSHVSVRSWIVCWVVLFWQGCVSGYVWRMSCQIWPSIIISAIFFTIATYYVDVPS